MRHCVHDALQELNSVAKLSRIELVCRIAGVHADAMVCSQAGNILKRQSKEIQNPFCSRFRSFLAFARIEIGLQKNLD